MGDFFAHTKNSNGWFFRARIKLQALDQLEFQNFGGNSCFKRQSMAENVEYLRSINVRAILSFGPPQAAEKSGFGDSRITIYSGKTQYVIRAAVGGQKIGFSTLKLWFLRVKLLIFRFSLKSKIFSLLCKFSLLYRPAGLSATGIPDTEQLFLCERPNPFYILSGPRLP